LELGVELVGQFRLRPKQVNDQIESSKILGDRANSPSNQTSWRSHAGETYLFPGRHLSHHWKHLHPNSADRILREAFEPIGIEGVSTHSFRRTARSRAMSNAGIPLRIIQEISGHSNSNNCSAKKEVKPNQVKGAIASLSMLSYRGIAIFPDQRLASGQLSTPTARDLSLPSQAPTISHSCALNSAFACSIVLA
jgi:hypothetical protein